MKRIDTLLSRYFWVLPVVYLFVAIFLLRSQVGYVYLASGLLIALTIAAHHYGRKAKPEIRLARWLVVLAAIGITASFILSIEKIELLTEPSRVASCSLSPVVACSPVIASWQASAFGLPNSFIGIFAYTAVFTAAMTIAAGAIKLTRAWWRTLLAGVLFGTGFASWLFYQGVFDIGKLCLYCMLVWLVTFAMLWLTTAYCIEKKHINLGAKLNKLLSHKAELIAVTYVIIFFLLFQRWADYWLSLI
ncbi:hypothetical protein CMN23_02125 [Candidatus Saccharibacteria bacterium]|jgi:uncharacterized membrane protein|nr:hypothetical protein [Candidatus Saccharibacteria bacterium]